MKILQAVFLGVGLAVSLPSTSLAGTGTLNDYNPYNVSIPDNGASVSTNLLLSGAPSGAVITKVKIYYEIRHTYVGDLKVWLTSYYNGSWHDYILRNQSGGSADDIVETRDNLTTWNGASPNQTWYLVAQDMASGNTGYIDFFELWVDYSTNDAPNTPTNEDPDDGTTGVSRNTDLDWSCSDPNGDTLYYTVYFEKNNSSPDTIVKNSQTGSSVSLSTLDYGSHYYWQVKADDHKGGVTWGPVWDFYTENEPVIGATITIQPIASVIQGNTLSVDCDVRNDGNVTHSFGVGAEIKDGASVIADLGTRTASGVSPGSTKRVNFTYDVPADWNGTYVAHCAVWTGTPGSSTWLDSNDRTFSVTASPLSLDGRIAYHAYSDYMAAPVDSDDGHLFVYLPASDSQTKVTSGLSVENAMNPHFSPDGSALVFMAIPTGAARSRNSLEVYVLDLASSSLARLTNDGVPDEDPKFSPDGSHIVWKRQGQVWRMNADGSSPTQLTFSPDEKSGPNYSPDGSKIVYWSEGGSDADIWWMNFSGSSPSEIVGNASIQDYYPIYRDADNILYSRWESSVDHHDKVFNYATGSGISTRLALNVTGVEDADAAPVDSTYLVFSSTRSGGDGSYDVYIARYDNGVAYSLPSANTSHKDLGPCYSPYTYARTATVLSPPEGSDVAVSSTVLLTARLRSDGGIWFGASPKVVFTGPVTVEFTGLRDDGTQGDITPGDGIYSKSVTSPSTPGSYDVHAEATSTEPGATRQVTSPVVSVTLYTPDTTPPTPDPATWATVPYSTGTTSIRMVATTASDPSGVEYYFDETSGNAGGSDSGWQDSPVYEDTDLAPNVTYTYSVGARDKSPAQNIGGYATAMLATTDATGTQDSDGDGIPDWWEYKHSGGNTNLMPHAHGDTDPFDNYEEWIADTNPNDFDDFFCIDSIHAGGTSALIYWLSSSNRVYDVYHSSNLMNVPPFNLLTNDLPGTHPMNCYTDTVHQAEPQNFYYIKVKIPE